MQEACYNLNIKKEFNPNNLASMNYKLKRIYRKHNNQKIKRWTKEESDLYSKFIFDHADLLKNASVKRAKKIFILMSNFIKTKNPSQCRSHHQKFYRKDNSEQNSIFAEGLQNNNAASTTNHEKQDFVTSKIKIEEVLINNKTNNDRNFETNHFEMLQREKNRYNKLRMEEEKKQVHEDQNTDNLNNLTGKQLDDFICSAKMLFNVNSQMQKLRKNFEDFEEKNLKVFKDSFDNLDFYNYFIKTQNLKKEAS